MVRQPQQEATGHKRRRKQGCKRKGRRDQQERPHQAERRLPLWAGPWGSVDTLISPSRVGAPFLQAQASSKASMRDPGRHSSCSQHSPEGREGVFTMPRNPSAKLFVSAHPPSSTRYTRHTSPTWIFLPILWMRRLRVQEAHLPACQGQSA